MTDERLKNLQVASQRRFLTSDEVTELLREVTQLLRDNQSLADGLNDWRDKCEAHEKTLAVLAGHEPSWSDDFCRARAALSNPEKKEGAS